MSNPKALFQVNHGSGWQTIAEVDIINGVVNPPNAWTMVRAMQKRICYTGYTPEKITIVPSSNNPRDTHFAGFAEALMREIFVETEPHNWSELITQAEPIIARRAYDLAKHALQSIDYQDRFGIDYAIKDIPDLPELPSEPQS